MRIGGTRLGGRTRPGSAMRSRPRSAHGSRPPPPAPHRRGRDPGRGAAGLRDPRGPGRERPLWRLPGGGARRPGPPASSCPACCIVIACHHAGRRPRQRPHTRRRAGQRRFDPDPSDAGPMAESQIPRHTGTPLGVPSRDYGTEPDQSEVSPDSKPSAKNGGSSQSAPVRQRAGSAAATPGQHPKGSVTSLGSELTRNSRCKWSQSQPAGVQLPQPRPVLPASAMGCLATTSTLPPPPHSPANVHSEPSCAWRYQLSSPFG